MTTTSCWCGPGTPAFGIRQYTPRQLNNWQQIVTEDNFKEIVFVIQGTIPATGYTAGFTPGQYGTIEMIHQNQTILRADIGYLMLYDALVKDPTNSYLSFPYLKDMTSNGATPVVNGFQNKFTVRMPPFANGGIPAIPKGTLINWIAGSGASGINGLTNPTLAIWGTTAPGNTKATNCKIYVEQRSLVLGSNPDIRLRQPCDVFGIVFANDTAWEDIDYITIQARDGEITFYPYQLVGMNEGQWYYDSTAGAFGAGVFEGANLRAGFPWGFWFPLSSNDLQDIRMLIQTTAAFDCGIITAGVDANLGVQLAAEEYQIATSKFTSRPRVSQVGRPPQLQSNVGG